MRFLFSILAVVALSAPLSLSAQTAESGFTTIAPSALIMDYDSGVVLYEKNARTPQAPASMTKIMTAELVFDRIRNGDITLDTQFNVSEEAWRRGGTTSGSSTMFLELGSSVRVEDLLRGVIIQSGNDACIVLAEGIAGSETAFADMMTKHARDLGLESATFRNSTGWPHPEHEISLLDLAKLAHRTISEYPEFYALYAERSFEWNGISQANRNPLLGRFTGADGLKTGHTEASGYGLVASAKRGDERRIVVFNGLDSMADRREEGLRLMQAAFDQFKVLNVYEAGEAIHEIDVFMGKSDTVGVTVDQNIQIGLPRGDVDQIKLELRSKEAIAAPVTQGDHIADLIVTLPGREAQTYPLIATETVGRKGPVGRAMAALGNLF